MAMMNENLSDDDGLNNDDDCVFDGQKCTVETLRNSTSCLLRLVFQIDETTPQGTQTYYTTGYPN